MSNAMKYEVLLPAHNTHRADQSAAFYPSHHLVCYSFIMYYPTIDRKSKAMFALVRSDRLIHIPMSDYEVIKMYAAGRRI